MAGTRGLLETMRELPPRHFEQFVADLWEHREDWNTEVTDKGRDNGLDVIGEPPGGGPRTGLQCKRKGAGKKVSSKDVRAYAAMREEWSDVHSVTVVTTSSFTSAAERTAARLDVRLIDGADLARMVADDSATDILEWYAAGKPGVGQ